MVSDSLHSCLPSKFKLKFASHEHKMLKNLNYDILLKGNLASSREAVIQEILDDIKLVEIRK